MALWLRVILYGIAAVMGVGGAMLGYSKDLTMLAILAVALVVEGINLLIRRSGPSDSENPD